MNLIEPKLLAAFGGGALVGSVVTFFITRSVVSKNWQAIADEQVASVKEHYRIVRKEGELADPENLVNIDETDLQANNDYEGEDFDEFNPEFNKPEQERQAELRKLAKRIADQGYEGAQHIIGVAEDEGVDLETAVDIHVEAKTSKKSRVQEHSLFDQAIPEGPDGEPRDPKRPYIVSIHEWAAPDEPYDAYDQPTIKWFVGDNTLLNSKEEIVLHPEELIGTLENLRFGHLSEDEDIVYIRNEKLGLAFEVIRIEEGYAASRGLNLDPDEDDGFERQRRVKRKANKEG
jgi:hypothetical protein